ncbi:MAG TPA: DUF805 domain-containing protein [Polaromonas sp.]|jgi:uncharacterized membrane protein YhaH (DUF805 family)
MNFGQAISTCFAKYAAFSGRASRAEFWWFFLFQMLVFVAASMVSDLVYGLASLGLLLPSLAVATRRLHDIGKSGWWQLIMLTGIGLLLLIYWWVQPTGEGANEYEAASA